MNDHYEKFQKLQQYVEKNKRFPEFKEDFTKIKKDELLYEKYRTFYRLENFGYHRNKSYLKQKTDEFLISGNMPSNFQILLDFLECALEYQKENLAWYTRGTWFNQNSVKIFDKFGNRKNKINGNNV